MIANVETITPAMAAAMLERNTINRSVMPGHVSELARDMLAGRWRLTSETISFASDGTLLDGQHRLLAVVASGVAISMLVVRGADINSFKALGRGRVRTTGTILGLAGVPNSVLVAGAMRYVIRWERGSVMSGYNPTTAEAFAAQERHPNVVNGTPHRRGLLPAGMAAAMRYITSLGDPQMSAEFFDRLASGDGLVAGSPVLALRERMIRNKGCAAKLPPLHVAALTVVAWNAYHRGARIGVLRWRPGFDPDPVLTPTAASLGFGTEAGSGSAA